MGAIYTRGEAAREAIVGEVGAERGWIVGEMVNHRHVALELAPPLATSNAS